MIKLKSGSIDDLECKITTTYPQLDQMKKAQNKRQSGILSPKRHIFLSRADQPQVSEFDDQPNSLRELNETPVRSTDIWKALPEHKYEKSNCNSQKKRKSSVLKNTVIKSLKGFFQTNLQQRFIYKLRKASNNLHLSHLNEKQKQIIFTLFNFEFYKQKNILNQIPVIDFTNPFILCWEILQIMTIVFSFIWLPFEYSFSISNTLRSQWIFNIIIINNMLDVLIQTNTSMIQNGITIRERDQILKIWLKQNSFNDFIQLTCLLIINYIYDQRYAYLIVMVYVLFRFPRLNQVSSTLNNYFNISLRLQDILELVQLIASLVFLVHVIACIWHKIGVENDSSWINFYGFQDHRSHEIYLVSFYWAAMTITTVGYGDITPKNSTEYLFVNIIMIFACIVFGYTVNRVGMIISKIHTRQAELLQNLQIFDVHLKSNKVPLELQSRIKNYLEHRWRLENDHHEKTVAQLTEKLSDQLKHDLNRCIKGENLLATRPFKRFSPNFRMSLCDLVEDVNFTPNETIIDPKRKDDDNSIFFIKSGNVVINQILGQSPLNFPSGSTFGEFSFFTNQPRQIQLISKDFSFLQKISQKSFLESLKGFQRDKELYHQIKDQLLFSNQLSKIGLNCLFCQHQAHNIRDCPMLHLSLNTEKIIQRELYPSNQERVSQFLRFTSKKQAKTLLSLSQINQSAQMIQSDISDKLSEDESYESLKKPHISEIIVSESIPYYSQENVKSQENFKSYSSNWLVSSSEKKSYVEVFKPGEQMPSIEISPDFENSQQNLKNKGFRNCLFQEGNFRFKSSLMHILSVPHFDKMCLYTHYFPNYNYDKVIEKQLIQVEQDQLEPLSDMSQEIIQLLI